MLMDRGIVVLQKEKAVIMNYTLKQVRLMATQYMLMLYPLIKEANIVFSGIMIVWNISDLPKLAIIMMF